MKLLVVGAGIIGVTTAYELARRGHEVAVVDREPGESRATSDATAGLIAPGHSFAWASPSAPMELVKSLFSSDTSIRVKPRFDPELISWGLKFLRECTGPRAHRNTLAKLRLAQRSQQLFNTMISGEGMDFRPSGGGVLYLHRDQEGLRRAVEHGSIMRGYGQPQLVVSREELLALEPALAASRIRFVGAVHDESDSTGNPTVFATEVRKRCEELGVRFTFDTTIEAVRIDRLAADGLRVAALESERGDVMADGFVLAGGPESARLARTAGVRLPVYPAKGYSLTAPINEGALAPALGGIDEKSLVAWSRFGDHLRMSATAEFAGYSLDYAKKDFDNILGAGQELFPGVLDYQRATYKVGLRPMTPDGPPIIGRVGESNLYINTGHGHLGWTMACGAAEMLADQIEGKPTALPADPYAVGR
ncbi:amino acid dehydrogenase [Paenarthrobacter nitroguajacolicus]|uniref:FAD-dependent oxidoreductase n=1 Tax=Paenarthrobacter nitroguajacolicus TaxID=211146 RepID=UPI0015BEDAE5|nr:FAD-dependent oxidoreductase [Paenarthrobacter nitroguajacolicus]NWL10053.1 amino acid dehydrogenase [Paenarthrobacter nitroguajacolicus]